MKKLNFFSFIFLFLALSNAVLAQVTTTSIVSNTTWSAAVNNQPLGLSAPATAASIWAANSVGNPTITGGWQAAIPLVAGPGRPAVAGATTIGRVLTETNGRAAYFRKNFMLSGCVQSATLAFNADDMARVFVNGTQVFAPTPLSSTTYLGSPINTLSTTEWSVLSSFNIASLLVAGNNTIAIELINYIGPSDFALAATINTSPLPVAAITGAITICSGSSITLTASGGGTYKWNTAATTAAINTSVAGTYTVTVTNSTGCTAVASTTVVVNPLPVATIAGTTTICQGSCTTLTASGGGAYKWNTNATTALISPCPTTNTTYVVTVTSAAGCKAVASKLVTVNPKPILTVTASKYKICKGDNANLNIISTNSCTGAYAILWNTGQTTQTISAAPTVNTTYFCTVTCPATGCSSTGQVSVAVSSGASINLVSQSVNCNGSTAGVSLDIAVTGIAPYTYLWNNGVTTQDLVNVLGTGTSYCVTVSDSLRCKTTRCFDCMNPCSSNFNVTPTNLGKVAKSNQDEVTPNKKEVITDFKVYPNPFNNDINVEWAAQKSATTENEKMTINIYNATGQLVKSQIVDDRDLSSKIQTNGLPFGLYNVVIESAGKVLSATKIIKD